MPALVGGSGNYFLPVHVGAPDMANLNLLYLKLQRPKKKVIKRTTTLANQSAVNLLSPSYILDSKLSIDSTNLTIKTMSKFFF